MNKAVLPWGLGAIMLVLFSVVALRCGTAVAADPQSGPDQGKRQTYSKEDMATLDKAWACNPFIWGTQFTIRQIRFANVDCTPPKMSYEDQVSLLDFLKRDLGEEQKSSLGRWLSGDLVVTLGPLTTQDQKNQIQREDQRKRERKADDPAVLQAFEIEEKRRVQIAQEQAVQRRLAEEQTPEYQAELRRQQALEQKRLEQEAAEAEVQKQAAAVAKAKEEREKVALEERKRKLKSGELKAANFSEAEIANSPVQGLIGIMASPLLVPDKGNYSGRAIVDGLERANLIRGKMAYGLVRSPELAYVFLRMSSKTVNYAPSKMRVGESVSVLGRYVDNVKYRTVSGDERTAPVIEVMYIGD